MIASSVSEFEDAVAEYISFAILSSDDLPIVRQVVIEDSLSVANCGDLSCLLELELEFRSQHWRFLAACQYHQ